MKAREATSETNSRELQILLDEAEQDNLRLDARLADQDAIMESLEADLQMQHAQISKQDMKGFVDRGPLSSVSGYHTKGSSTQTDGGQDALAYRSSFM